MQPLLIDMTRARSTMAKNMADAVRGNVDRLAVAKLVGR
jgi:hypothetical protein